MKTLVLTVASLLLASSVVYGAAHSPAAGDIYDTQIDGETQIATALAEARASGKNVLIEMGANWCVWCKRLHHLLNTNSQLKQVSDAAYVSILMDMDGSHNAALDKRLGNPTRLGFPVLIVLDANGKKLTTQETGALEDGNEGHDPEKVMAFLKKWAPKK